MYVLLLKDKPSKTKTLNAHKHLGLSWMASYISISRIKKTVLFIQIWLYSEYMQHCSQGTFQFCRVLNVAVTTPYHANGNCKNTCYFCYLYIPSSFLHMIAMRRCEECGGTSRKYHENIMS